MREYKFIERYFNQDKKLSERLVKKLQSNYEGELKYYACSDLSSDLKFIQHWIIIWGEFLVQADRDNILKIVKLSELKKVKQSFGVSCSTLSFFTESDEESNKDSEAAFSISFTNRQKVAMSQLKYIVDQVIEGQYIAIDVDAHKSYAQAVTRSLKEKQSGKDVDTSKVVWRLLAYLKPYRKILAIGGVAATLMTIVSLLPAYFSGKLIDSVIRPFQDGKLDQAEALNMAWMILGSLVAVKVLKEFFLWVRFKNMSVIGEWVARDLRRDLYNHLQRLGMDFYSSKQTGSIISRVSSDTDRIWDFVAFGVVEVSISTIMLMSLGIVLISLDWKLGMVMVVPVPLLLYSIYRHGEGMKKLFLRCWRKWSDLTDVLSDTIPGIQVVKAFNQESREKKRFEERNEKCIEEFMNVHYKWTTFWPILMLSIHAITLIVWTLAIPRMVGAAAGAEHLSVGVFVSFLLYMTMFAQPIEVIGQMARMLNRATSSAYRIFEILDTKPTMINAEDAVELDDLKGEIEFKDVIFSYDGVRQVLKGLNLKIEAGEMIGLVGSSGGGKSTLTKLINRFYDVTSGSITIDGIDLRKIELGYLRRSVGIVLQDPYLFHGSILENIRYGMQEASYGEVIKAAKIANAHDFIMKFRDGYDTVVGERGQTLSGGERQRISIARAILHNPKILILDEATSAVDTETERNIQEALDRLIEGRTVIAIAHRLSTLRKANRIFVVKEGKVVEKGTHAELISMSGEYKKLQDMQQEMNLLMEEGIQLDKEHGNEISTH